MAQEESSLFQGTNAQNISRAEVAVLTGIMRPGFYLVVVDIEEGKTVIRSNQKQGVLMKLQGPDSIMGEASIRILGVGQKADKFLGFSIPFAESSAKGPYPKVAFFVLQDGPDIIACQSIGISRLVKIRGKFISIISV